MSHLSDKLNAIRGLAIIVSFSYHVVAVCYASFKPHWSIGGRMRKVQLVLCGLAVLSTGVQTVIAISNSNPASTNDPDVVYSLFLTLIWSILLLETVDTSSGTSYPRYGAWGILLVSESVVLALQVEGEHGSKSFRHGSIVLQSARILLATLLCTSVVMAYCGNRKETGTDEETQALLADPDSPSKSNETDKPKKPDQDELDRLEIRNRPKWQYLASFKIFVPFMYPKGYRNQALLGGMLLSSLVERIVMVVLPLSLGAIVSGLSSHIPWAAIGLYCFLRFCSSAAGLSLLETYLSWQIVTDMTIALNRCSYDHIMNLSADFHDSKKSSIIWQTMHQGQDVIDFLKDIIFSFMPTIIDFGAAAVVLTIMFGPYMLFIIMSTTIFFYWLTFKALAQNRELSRVSLDAWHDQYYQLTESTVNWYTVSHFGRLPYEKQRYRDKGDAKRAASLTFWVHYCWSRGLRYSLLAVYFVAACCVGALQIAYSDRKVGDFVILVTYWSQLTNPLDSLAYSLSRMGQKMVNAEKLLVLLEKSPRVQDVPESKPFTFLAGAVDFENVSFSYDGQRKVADNITFSAAPGQTVALVGRTGGGKSTLLKLLFRFYDPDQGRILVDGQDIRQVTMESFRKHIAVIPQTPVVFNMTIMENMRYPDLECTDEEIIEACKAAALHEKITTFTNGYQEQIGERGTKLSGGELQRLAIARAMLKKANILLLDEATSAVDSITEKQIQGSLRKLCAGKTTFVIAHRLSTILHADQILVVHEGHVVESGTHNSLMKQNGSYNELWSSQLQLQATDDHGNSRSRSPRKKETPFFYNDLSSNGEDSRTLVTNGNKDSKKSDEARQTEDPSKADGKSHKSGSDGRGRTRARQLARALSRTLSRSKSPTDSARAKSPKPPAKSPTKDNATAAESLSPSVQTATRRSDSNETDHSLLSTHSNNRSERSNHSPASTSNHAETS
ncbi:uncharacterized protein PV06_02406 [Exophiala oligosperma]|uniref:Heavy metal tolerance protein n=1 Tax=Exophiala oligosperma TaxID=215243 RepID=A0A0D2DUE1_9EURO|nr:uncharacterized protein PV06_02406 [Exophiala oligosperma]KIW46768.1 hypothetical protein PV06_02406 [Exophiala oligosperma]